MSDLRFQKLTPTSNVDLNVYEEGFEFIFSNDDIRNIAVSGPYSSGKSSLLESYKKKYPQKTFIHISLAHFTNENKDNEEKEIEDSETVIEGKILNQLIQQIPIENIPQSNFRIKRTTGTNYNGYWAMGIVAFIGMLLFVLNYGKYCTWINEMNSAVWNYEWLRKFMFFLASPFGWVLSVLCIVVIACLGLYNLLNIQTNKNIFKKISVQGNEIEIFEDSQNSYFDKYLNEVLYLFENSKADVIVFEDIDRFENVQIFERLREINMLTNCRLQQHEEEEKVLRFFYLLKDDIFITKDRAKFFDYILPVVPVLDSSNSYNKIKEFFVESTVEEKLNDRFLKGLALYIDDIRVLKNIYNEFVIYYERLKKIDLDPNRMLTLVTYKNLFPRDFADLQLNKGFVHAIFSNKEKFCCKEIERINNEIQELEERIKNSEDELAVSLEELDDIRAAKYERADDGSYWHNIDKTFLKWEKEQLPIRKQAVEDRAIDTQQLLEKQLKELKKQKKRISGRSISQIINRDNIDMIFQITTTNELGDVTDYNQIKKSEYFNLLKYLIRNGYIDESYSDYMTYFYENSLTLNDKTFLRSVNDKKAKEYSYNLDSPLLVVSNLIPEDFLQEETLNFDLLEYLLGSENNKEYLGNLAIQLQEKMQLEFISQYFALNEKRVEFVRWLNKQWTGLFSYTYKGRKLSKEFLFLYSLYSVAYCSIDVLTEMNEEQVFSHFISNQEDFLIDSNCTTDQMIDKLVDLDIKFETINPQSNTSLLTGVYENNLYVINATNIRLFLSFAYQIDEKIIQGHIMTAIMSKKDQPLCKYVCSNLNNTIEIINAMSTEGVDDDEEIILYILNSEQVNEETKEMYISLLKTVLHDLSKVMDENCRDNLLNRHLVDESAENICEYFSKQSLTDVLIRFINEISNELDFSLVDYDENIIQQFAECIQASNKIVNTHYRSIVSAQGKVLTDFSAMDLDEAKVKILIDECKLQMNISNLRRLRQCYPDCVLHFIEKNLREYCEIMSQKYIEIDEVEEILTWDILKIEDAKQLIDILPTTLKVIDHDYSDDIIAYILGECFSEDEFIPLLEKFFLYSAKVQNAIIELSDSRMNKVVESMENIDFNILKKILTSDNIQHTNKVILLCEIIKKYKPDRIKEALIIAGYEEVSKLLDNKTRPRISANNEHKQLLNALKDNRFIISYEFNEKSGIYSYTRSTKKRNDLPPEFL